jgi:hypothetical protein
MADDWSLQQLLEDLHKDIESKLSIVRGSIGHATSKGDASESVWLTMLNTYLPRRYKALKAHVVDSEDTFSDQIDIVICDRQYTPFIFSFEDTFVVPAEGVYAIFEAKQTIDAGFLEYAQNKVESVRKLVRTSLPIPHAGGVYPAKPVGHILGGIVSFQSEWKSPPLGETLIKRLTTEKSHRQLDLGCVAAHGVFARLDDGNYEVTQETRPATAFLLELIARLQSLATVPMIDVRAYAKWLSPDIDKTIIGS